MNSGWGSQRLSPRISQQHHTVGGTGYRSGTWDCEIKQNGNNRKAEQVKQCMWRNCEYFRSVTLHQTWRKSPRQNKLKNINKGCNREQERLMNRQTAERQAAKWEAGQIQEDRVARICSKLLLFCRDSDCHNVLQLKHNYIQIYSTGFVYGQKFWVLNFPIAFPFSILFSAEEQEIPKYNIQMPISPRTPKGLNQGNGERHVGAFSLLYFAVKFM